MKKFYIATLAVIAVNLILSIWGFITLPKELPLHFDLDGNSTSTLASWKLFIYPLVSFVIVILCKAAIHTATKGKISEKRQYIADIRKGNVMAFSLMVALITICSTCVVLTGGCHFFMFAEPTILILGIAFCIIRGINIYKKR